MYVISGCLCGINCRYDGNSSFNPIFLELLINGNAIPVCPEQLGGLTTPRNPCEIINGSGIDVIDKLGGKVITKNEEDVTEYFLRGAYETLNIVILTGATKAILKSRSPSCGISRIYDGTFSSKLKSGDGVTAALLRKNNLKIISDVDYLKGV